MEERTTLFVRFTRRIPNSVNIVDEFKALHNSVKDVTKPREKSARWCLVVFEKPEEAEEVKKLLTEKQFVGGIRLKPQKLNIKTHTAESGSSDNARKKYVNKISKKTFVSEKFLDKYSNKLMVTQLPAEVTKKKIEDMFPSSLDIYLTHKPLPKAIVTFSSAEDARDARMSVNPIVQDQKIRVIMLPLQRKEKPDQPKKPNFVKRKQSDSKVSAPQKKPRYFKQAE